MGVLSTLYTGVAGLMAQGDALGVIGDNIANANTTGFKANRAEFADMIAGGSKIGRGSKLSAVNPILAQGNVDVTERFTDMSITGEGYFVLRGSEGETFTRDGSFHFDKSGLLVTNDGQRVQGFVADSEGRISNKLDDIKFPRALVPAKATKDIKLDINLDSRTSRPKTFDPKNPYDTSHFSTGVEVFDSQGNKHLVNFFFVKTADRAWNYYGLCDGKEITGGKEGEMVTVATGALTFNVDGKLDTETQTSGTLNFTGGAQQGQTIKVDFGDSITTDKGTGALASKQFAKDSDLISWKQDGAPAGSITGFTFSEEGIMSALYSNGKIEDIAQVAVSKFDNPESLIKIGNNRLRESRESGNAAIGGPSRAGRGKVASKSLERSTVDVAIEFVNLIQNQRGFQANAKTVTTTDELLGEVINMKR